MPKSVPRVYSRHTEQATALLGSLIRAARKQRMLSAQEVAERAGISRGLLQRIEKGDGKCEIGAAFEAATIVGVTLFDADDKMITRQLRQTEEKLALLPKSIRRKNTLPVHDAF